MSARRKKNAELNANKLSITFELQLSTFIYDIAYLLYLDTKISAQCKRQQKIVGPLFVVSLVYIFISLYLFLLFSSP